MLRTIIDPDEIAMCQSRLERALKARIKDKADFVFGYPGGHGEWPAYFNDDMWWGKPRRENDRIYNWFGTEKLVLKQINNISVEINVPRAGINRKVNGLFAKDEDSGDVFIMHRGKLRGVEKDTFLSWYRGRPQTIKDGDRISEALPIACLDSSDSYYLIRDFTREVEIFKRENKEGRLLRTGPSNEATASPHMSFKPETYGIREAAQMGGMYVMECNHGRIVNALEEKIKQSINDIDTFSTKALDLGISRAGNVTHVYEIKTSDDSQSIYTGIGQLIYHSTVYKTISPIKMSLVLPQKDTSNELRGLLHKMNINLIEYKMVGERITFIPTLPEQTKPTRS